MTEKREFTTDSLAWRGLEDRALWKPRPESDLAALMELAPGQTQRYPSLEATAALKEIIGRAIDRLDWEDRAIIEGLFVWGLSLRQMEAALGVPKTTVARRRDRIRRRLMADLSESERVRDWLRGVY